MLKGSKSTLKFTYTGAKLRQTAAECGCAAREIGKAVHEGPQTLVNLRHAIRICLEALRQGRHALYKSSGSVCQLAGTLIYLRDAICILLDAIRELARAIGKLVAAICRLTNTVGELTCAVREVSAILFQIGDLLIHIFQNTVVVLFDLFVIIEEAGEYHCHAGAHLEVCGIQCDLDRIRDFQVVQFVLGLLAGLCLIEQMLCIVLCTLQAVRETRESHADDNRVLALGDDRAIVDGDVLHIVIGEDDACHGREGDVYVVILLCVLIVNVNSDLTGLAGQIFGSDLLPLIVIGDLLLNRRLLVGRSLVVDVVAARIPRHHLAILCKGLIALDVLDILQCGVVIELVRAVLVLEPVGNGHALLLAACVREYVYGFFLFCILGLGAISVSFYCCGECGCQILFCDGFHRLRMCINAAVDGCHRRRHSRHGHICCHRHCKKQGKNLFSFHDYTSPL